MAWTETRTGVSGTEGYARLTSNAVAAWSTANMGRPPSRSGQPGPGRQAVLDRAPAPVEHETLADLRARVIAVEALHQVHRRVVAARSADARDRLAAVHEDDAALQLHPREDGHGGVLVGG